MRIALVASSILPEPGRLERRVDHLARGLAERGAEVEILAHGRGQSGFERRDAVTIRRFPLATGPLRFAVSPRLRERLRQTSREFDIVDVHTRQAPLALAAASARVRCLVLTPCASVDVFLGRPHARETRAVMAGSAQIVCRSEMERNLLCEAVPRAMRQTVVVPDGIDLTALRSAQPFAVNETVVLAVDRLDRATGVERAIAAMASLDPEFRLVVVGDGPARDRLSAFAADLRVSSRVQFVGAISDDVLHRWLQTARVVVALGAEHSSGSVVAEACAAEVSVVASDLPVHRGAAQRVGGGTVIFLPPRGSPLDVADAIEEAARLRVLPNPALRESSAPSWESVVDATWNLYRQLLGESPLSERHDGVNEVVAALTGQLHAGATTESRPALTAEVGAAPGLSDPVASWSTSPAAEPGGPR